MTQIYQKQKEYFRSGVTLDVSWRRKQLQALYDVIVRKEKDITDALYKDLGKSAEESYMSEIGMVLSEITHVNYPDSKESRLVTHSYGPGVITR